MDYNYNYNYTYPSTSVDPAAAAAVGAVFITLAILWLASYAITAFLLGRIFKKAGVPQWTAWVPFYNGWKFLEIGDQQGFWAVLTIIPLVNIVSAVFFYIAAFKVAKKLGKEDWFILLAIFLPIVWMIWLAFDDSKWEGGKKKVVAETAAKKVPAKKPATKSRKSA